MPTKAEFEQWFNEIFDKHDEDHDGQLDQGEAEKLARHLHEIKQDGTAFDEERAKAGWEKHSQDGHLQRATLFGVLLERAIHAGKITDHAWKMHLEERVKPNFNLLK